MNPEQTTNNPTPKSKKPGILIAIGVIVIVAIVVFFAERGSSTPTTSGDQSPADTSSGQSATPTAADNNPPASTEPQTSAYKDGTYTATGSYMSPGGPDKVGLSVTLVNGVITDATVTPMPGDPTSSHYQGIFAANYKQYVIGKSIDSVHLSVVSGSSLTSGGFNDALTQIKAQAKA